MFFNLNFGTTRGTGEEPDKKEKILIETSTKKNDIERRGQSPWTFIVFAGVGVLEMWIPVHLLH